MGYRQSGEATRKVDLSTPQYWVIVRRMTKKQSRECTAALMGAVANARIESNFDSNGDNSGSKQVIEQAMDNDAYLTALLVNGISSWNLDDEAGAIQPINAVTVNDLYDSDSDRVVVAIKDLNKDETKDPKPANA